MLNKPSALRVERPDSSSLSLRMHSSAASSAGSSRRTTSDHFGFTDTDESTSLASTPRSLNSTSDVRSDVMRPDPDEWQGEEKKEHSVPDTNDDIYVSSPPADYSEAADQLRRQIRMHYLEGGNRIRLRGAKGRSVNSSKLQPIVEVKTPQQLSGPMNNINQEKLHSTSSRVLLARGIGNVQFAIGMRSGGLESNQGPTMRQQSVKIMPFTSQDGDDDEYYSLTMSTCTTDLRSAPVVNQVKKLKSPVITGVVSGAESTGHVKKEKSLVLAGMASGGSKSRHSFDTVAVSFWLAELLDGTLLSSVKAGGGKYGKARRYSVKVRPTGEVLLIRNTRGVFGSVQQACELVATKAVDISALELQLFTPHGALYVKAPSRETFEVWTAGMASIFAYCKTLSAKRTHKLAKPAHQSLLRKIAASDAHSFKSLISFSCNTI